MEEADGAGVHVETQESIAQRLWESVVRHYDGLSGNGKPLLANANEFTALAAIVARIRHRAPNMDNIEVLSLATGTKCVGADEIDEFGKVISDSHAEILARRGFVCYLTAWIHRLQSDHYASIDDSACPVFQSEGSLRVKENWYFYLAISDSPCGDASIYNDSSGQACFTGAKLMSDQDVQVEISASATTCVREAAAQQLCCMRLKTGRSDITHRSQSKSCSDKICRWVALGLQGGLLHRLIGRVSLSGVIVTQDPATTSEEQAAALRRSLWDRWQGEFEVDHPLELSVVQSDLFPQSKAIVKHRLSQIPIAVAEEGKEARKAEVEVESSSNGSEHRAKRRRLGSASSNIVIKTLPCSTSINWHLGQQVEVVIAQSGLPQGASMKQLKHVKGSRLSRYRMLPLFQQVLPLLSEESAEVKSYKACKRKWLEGDEKYCEERQKFFGVSVFRHWHTHIDTNHTI